MIRQSAINSIPSWNKAGFLISEISGFLCAAGIKKTGSHVLGYCIFRRSSDLIVVIFLRSIDLLLLYITRWNSIDLLLYIHRISLRKSELFSNSSNNISFQRIRVNTFFKKISHQFYDPCLTHVYQSVLPSLSP